MPRTEREPTAWVFDALPPSRARRGGDPSSHAFRQDVSTFVREVIQNANDQALDDSGVQVHFRFIELAGAKLAAFKRAIAWRSLEPHLRAASETRGGRNLEQFLDEVDERKQLLLLRVEDRGTVGLTGDELSGDSHFRALCKDTLYSHKRIEGAGGSYGLGKSVLWAFSGLSTVLFNSNLSEEIAGQRSPRLIGRTELPSHEVAGRTEALYGGAGWFGRRVEDAGATRAESVWGERAEELASKLHLERGDDSGTSLLIVGFRDPTTDDNASAEELAAEIRRAAERDFWPALTMPGRPLAVWVVATSAHILSEKHLDSVRPFIECYRQRNSTQTSLETPGDVVVRDIPVNIPGRRDGTPPTQGHVKLCVRLADEQASDVLLGHVAMFRRPGMVVRYWNRRNVALGARPFHAVLACGEARAPGQESTQDAAVERFLRAAEPPGHDVWQTTAALKAEYKQGYKKAIDQLHARVGDALRELVVSRPKQGAAGPDLLRKRFPIGNKGSDGSEPSAFHFSGVNARFSEGRWHFEGTIRSAVGADRWRCTVALRELDEDGGPVTPVAIAHLKTSNDAASMALDGVARIEAVPGAQAISFSGYSDEVPLSGPSRGELGLELVGTTE